MVEVPLMVERMFDSEELPEGTRTGDALPVVSYARISSDTTRDGHGVFDQHSRGPCLRGWDCCGAALVRGGSAICPGSEGGGAHGTARHGHADLG